MFEDGVAETAAMMRVRFAASLPPWLLVIVALLSMELGSALSANLIATVGPAGTAWLRLSMGAILFLALVRPSIRAVRRSELPVLLGLGVSTGAMSVAFLAAIERIEFGTAVAVTFLGPVAIAAVRSRSIRALGWPGLALVGVILLTEPWRGSVDVMGIGFASVSAISWVGYILLTHRIGDRFTHLIGPSLTVPIAALTAASVGIPQASGHITLGVLAAAAGLALLFPVVPISLELIALRRMTPNAFGILMALDPAVALIIGALVLHQMPSTVQVVGIVLVVLAGAAAARGNGRETQTSPIH